MRNISTEALAEIKSEISSSFFLLELNLNSDYYYTDRDINLYYNGHNYLATGFEFTNISYSASMSVDKVTISIDNVELEFSALLLGQDVRNKTAILSFGCYGRSGVVWDSDAEWDSDIAWSSREVLLGATDLFRGFISDWKVTETRAEITLVNEFIFWSKKALRTAQAACPWNFKGTECGYSGAEDWCDKSYDRCVALNNTDNFGGFRFLPSLIEKEVWWGRSPSD